MSEKNDTAIAAARRQDPFAALRQITAELERVFDEPFGFSRRGFRWPSLAGNAVADAATWTPKVDVFERDGRLVTKVDLPGLKKEEVKVEVTDGHLAISGERKTEREEKKDNVLRTERSYGSFYRTVPLPEGAKLEDVKATFADGVLEVSVPLAAKPQATVRKVEVQDGNKAAKTAA
jgi:HSP20 family protein